jgi:5,5'-dehydrodivanillate O-demethylase
MAEDAPDWTTGHPILFPNILAQGGPSQMSFQMRIPTDDNNTMHIVIMGLKPENGEPARKEVPVLRDPVIRDELGRVFADNIVRQDEMAWIGQGPVSDRTSEHLVTSDRGIVLYHKLLLEQMEKVERGEEPMAVIRDLEENFPMVSIARGSTYTSFRDGIQKESYGGGNVEREGAEVTAAVGG